MTEILSRFRHRARTAAAWTSLNEVLLPQELGIETDTGRAKLGDGTTAWAALPYWYGGGVSSFNTRTGAVTLTYADVTGALGFTPTTVSGAVSAVAAAATGIIKSNGSALSAAVAGTDYQLPVIIAQSAVAASITGTTTETTLATVTIPANAMGANGRIEIDAIWSYTNSANTKTLRQKFGGTTVLSTAVGASAAVRTSAVVANRGATNSQIATPNFSTSFGVSSAALLAMAIDTTAAVNITLTGQLANTGETITLEAYSVKLFK